MKITKKAIVELIEHLSEDYTDLTVIVEEGSDQVEVLYDRTPAATIRPYDETNSETWVVDMLVDYTTRECVTQWVKDPRHLRMLVLGVAEAGHRYLEFGESGMR